MADLELQVGAEAFKSLLSDIQQATSRMFVGYEGDDYDEDTDPRDYKEFAGIVEQALTRSFVEATGPQREGFVRALASFFSIVIDGAGPNMDTWDPLAETEASYAMPRAKDMLQRIAN